MVYIHWLSHRLPDRVFRVVCSRYANPILQQVLTISQDELRDHIMADMISQVPLPWPQLAVLLCSDLRTVPQMAPWVRAVDIDLNNPNHWQLMQMFEGQRMFALVQMMTLSVLFPFSSAPLCSFKVFY